MPSRLLIVLILPTLMLLSCVEPEPEISYRECQADFPTSGFPERDVLFEESGSLTGLTSILNGRSRLHATDLNDDGLVDLVADGNADGSFPAVAINLGLLRYEDATSTSGIGATEGDLLIFGDVDRDGDVDLYTGGEQSPQQGNVETGIWLNDGTGTFRFDDGNGTDILSDAPVPFDTAAGTFADFDNDGDLDLYLGAYYEQNSARPQADRLLENDGRGRFTDRTANLGDQAHPLTQQYRPDRYGDGRGTYGLSPGDYDSDGDIDLFVNNYGAGRPAGNSPPAYIERNFLWRNDGNFNFTDVAPDFQMDASPRGTNAIQDEDSEVGPVELNNVTYPGPIGGNGFGSEWGDLDNDGDLDLIVGQIAHPDYTQSDRTLLYINDGSAGFREISTAAGLEYREDELMLGFVDFDNDGWLDIWTAGLRDTFGGNDFRLYRRTGPETYERLSNDLTGIDDLRQDSVVWTDMDADGDLDLVIGGPPLVYLNTNGNLNTWLSVQFEGDAAGIRVEVTSALGTQTRELTAGNGHRNPQPSQEAHFGLGDDTCASTLRYRRPGGTWQSVSNVGVNQRLWIRTNDQLDVLTGLADG